MGAGADGAYSRPPRIEDLVSLCRALNESGAQYLVVGGFAMVLHGYPRATMDVDLLVDPAPENIRKVKAALACLPDNAAAQVADTDVQEFQVVRVGDAITVDLLGRACSVDFGQAWPSAERRSLEGVEIPFPDAKTLILTKDTVRPKDQQDVQFLRLKLGEGA